MNDDKLLEDFEATLKLWGGRPPDTAAADAVSDVMRRLPGQRMGLRRRGLLAAAAVVVAGAVALLQSLPGRHSGEVVGSLEPAPPLEENVMLFYLDPETPVYFVLPQPGDGGV